MLHPALCLWAEWFLPEEISFRPFVLKGGGDIGVSGDTECQGFAAQLLQIIMQFLNLAEKAVTSSPVSTHLPFWFN